MAGLHKNLLLDYPAIVLSNPGTPRQRTYLIRVANISPSGMWFHSTAHLSQGTPAQVTFHLKYGFGQRAMKVKFSGRVVHSDPGGFTVAFQNS